MGFSSFLLAWASAWAVSVAADQSSQSRSALSCRLSPAVDPFSDGLPSASDLFASEEALLKQVERHGAIVKIPSVSYDDNGDPGDDPRWEVFYSLHRVLEAYYPNLHSRMTRETVNTFGLVYTLKGSDSSLKPLMLAAHQDVVPVPDATTWTYPPFSAHFDGQWLWGRGASDDKNSLTALMSAVETLLGFPQWEPKRTIILAFGFDEECSGHRGAQTIGPFLERRYGPNAMALILDEGGNGLDLVGNDTLYALPAVREKGHMDLWIELYVNGGHASTPFPHTGIGIMSQIVNTLESHPYEPLLERGSPVHNHLVCLAKYSPEAFPNITRLIHHDDLASLTRYVASLDRASQYRIQTSQAVDYFLGGAKINAMPEYVKIGLNYRIAPQNSADEIKSNILKHIRPIVKEFALKVIPFPEDEEKHGVAELGMMWDDDLAEPQYTVDYNGTLILSVSSISQTTPISSTSDPVWDLFSGTIRHTFAFGGGRVVPVGEVMTGNTDTRHYLNLTEHVYRFMPTRNGGRINAHTVDERIDMFTHMEALSFYYDLIRNFDASDIAATGAGPSDMDDL